MQERDREFADAARVVHESAVLRFLTRASDAVGQSIERSMTWQWVRRVRVTHIGVVITSACVTHALLLRWLPNALAPVKPLGYVVVVAFAAVVVAAGRMTMRSSATAMADRNAGIANAMKS
jgi:hypothetical protein